MRQKLFKTNSLTWKICLKTLKSLAKALLQLVNLVTFKSSSYASCTFLLLVLLKKFWKKKKKTNSSSFHLFRDRSGLRVTFIMILILKYAQMFLKCIQTFCTLKNDMEDIGSILGKNLKLICRSKFKTLNNFS